jgi:cysteine-rich repeat protein
MQCSGYECTLGGDGYCKANGNQRCINTANNPCFLCLPQPEDPSSQPSSLPPSPECTGAACVSGGASFCGGLNLFCTESNEQPCILCTDTPADISLRHSDDVIPPSCLCDPGEKCVDDVCLLPDMIANLPIFCGNARVDPGELCDEGSLNSDRPNAGCRTDCTPGRCGDGLLDTPLELCDDGNMLNGDGCSSVCHLERGAPETLPGQVVELPFEEGGQGSAVSGQPATPPRTSDTGPAALALMIAGAAAGVAWMRRRHRL